MQRWSALPATRLRRKELHDSTRCTGTLTPYLKRTVDKTVDPTTRARLEFARRAGCMLLLVVRHAQTISQEDR